MTLKDIIDKMAILEGDISDWKTDINLNGKNLQSALIEQPSYLARYDQIAAEANYLVDCMDIIVKRVRAERIRFIKDTFARDYTDSAIQKIVDGDKRYLDVYQVYIEVKYLYDRCKSLVDAFKQRSYALNNIVKVRESELEDITISLDY